MNLRAALIPAVALLALGILLWRQFSLEADLEALRGELRAMPRVAAAPAPATLADAFAPLPKTCPQDGLLIPCA